MLTTSASLRIVTRDLDRSLATVAKDPQVKRETAYFLSQIGKIKSVDEFLKNQRVFAYAMDAFGLSDMTYAKAFMKKVLKDGIDSRQSFANQLSDQRFREFAATFNFARHGGAATVFDKAQQGTADRYVRMKLEERVGRTDEGVRLALYFQRKAADITSAYNILGDAALLRVAQTALGIPAVSSSQDIAKQAAEIAAKLDLEDLRDPEFLAKFLDRFANRWQIANGSAEADVPQLLLGSPVESSINPSTLLAMQSIRRR
jgi:hypothetical protein